MTRAVLFDLDGTLVDSVGLIDEAFRYACRTVLGRDPSEAEVFARWGEPLPARFTALAPDRVEALVAEYTQYYEAHLHRLRSFPGVEEMLRGLRACGCRLGVVTSKRRRTTEATLRQVGLEGVFEVVVSAEDVGRPKPAPDPVRTALWLLQTPAGRAWMVGDGVFDLQAGRAAGVRTVAALWGSREREALLQAGPDHVAETPEAVVSLICGP